MDTKHRDCNHELEPGELWIGNTKVTDGKGIPDHLKELKTIRLGKQAYYIDGEPIPTDYCLPLIIHKSEEMALERIYKERSEKIALGWQL